MKISGSDPVRCLHAKHASASARCAEARDHERSLERSEKERRVRPYDTADRITFSEYLQRENLEAPDEVSAGSGDQRDPDSGAGAPQIGDVFPLEITGDGPGDATGYDRCGRSVYQQATSGFTVRTLDVVA